MIGSLLAAGLAVMPARAGAAGAPTTDVRLARDAPASASAPTSRARTGEAPPSATAPVSPPATDRERARLAVELDRANAEIDALKRSPRGIRDDYRLRNRMADAEALARRLTELDAKAARLHPVDGSAQVGAWPAELPAAAGDDRADLEAKADILADQAGRLSAEANRIDTRIRDLRGRRELRRRAGQLERDPFSPLEQAKGRAVITTGRTLAPSPSDTKASGPSSTGAGSTPTVSIDDPRGVTGASSPPPTTTTSSPGGVTSGGSGQTVETTGSVAAQLHAVLDPAALAEIRRLEAPGSAPSSLAALESALATLRARAAQLNRSATALRAHAATLP